MSLITDAVMCLIRGSGSSRNAGAIAGSTLDAVRSLDSWLWIEQVMSKAIPINGVSRGQNGDWKVIEDARLPRELLRQLRTEALRERVL